MSINFNDYSLVVVGAGLYGSVVARSYADKYPDRKVLVLDRSGKVAGNCSTKVDKYTNIMIHEHGAHIFHTSNERVWKYVNRFGEFNNYINSPVANYKGKLYNLPFNMNTFYQIYGVTTPSEAHIAIDSDKTNISDPQNLEEQSTNLVGTKIYELLIKGYTEKQWGIPCTELPSSIIKRLPLRFTYDNNYFNDKYQGIPKEGYSELISNMLNHNNIDLRLNYDFMSITLEYLPTDTKLIYTGSVDELLEYKFGALPYRSLEFKTSVLIDNSNYQGVAVMNYTDKDTEFTRVIEHKHFDPSRGTNGTIITREYPVEFVDDETQIRYYPMIDHCKLYDKYVEYLKDNYPSVILGGRLGLYKYLNMDQVVLLALELSDEL